MQESLNVKELLFLVRKKIVWIIAITVLGGILAMTVSMFFITEKYTSTVHLYVNNTTIVDPNNPIKNADIDAALMIINTNITIMKSDPVSEKIDSLLKKPIGTKAVKDSLNFSSDNKASVINISSTTTDPKLSAEICDILADIAPDMLYDIIQGGSAKRIDNATVPQKPSSPNTKRNTLLGAGAGLIITLAIIIIRNILDNTVKGEEDIKAFIDIPVLGEIPSLEQSKKHKKPKSSRGEKRI